MNKTTHYHLNQWEGEDRILRADFNADNTALDGALHRQAEAQAALEGALAAEQQARTAGDAGSVQAAREAVAEEEAARKAAVAAEASARGQQDAAIRSEVSAAVAGAKSEAAGALEAERTARTGQDAAIRQEFAAADLLVKLREVTTSAAATQVDLSLGGIDLSRYAELMILVRLNCPGETIGVRVNNVALSFYVNSNSSSTTQMASIASLDAGGYTLLHFYPLGGSISARFDSVFGFAGTGSTTYAVLKPASGVTLANLSTFNFYGNKGGTISAGGKFTIYGVKV